MRLPRGLSILFSAATVLTPLSVPSAADAPPVQWTVQTSGVTVRLRGMSAVSARVAWASGANGTVLRTVNGGATWEPRPVPGGEQLDFRDIDAFSADVAYALSIGPGPASRIYKTTDGGSHWMLQFTNADADIFFDAMAFLDARRGFAFSDSVGGQFVLLATADGGGRWERIPGTKLPPAKIGEGAFAASGTNVAVYGGRHVWVGTSAARVLRSSDTGATWTIAPTPLRTGESAGIFSIAFRDALHGVVVGGDYRQERDAIDNAAVTSDNGATWTLVSGRGLSGFRSVVAWVPGTAGSLIAIGPSGSDWSTDGGRTWAPIAGGGYDTFSFAPGTRSGWAAGDGGRIARLTIAPPDVRSRLRD
jgi:photosystem II stability/assembly factor-like uncharacterized protein